MFQMIKYHIDSNFLQSFLFCKYMYPIQIKCAYILNNTYIYLSYLWYDAQHQDTNTYIYLCTTYRSQIYIHGILSNTHNDGSGHWKKNKYDIVFSLKSTYSRTIFIYCILKYEHYKFLIAQAIDKCSSILQKLVHTYKIHQKYLNVG